MCESKELIVGFVYDELSADERVECEAHLAVCAGCRIEVEELRSTRGHLALWAPPEPDLGFRVIGGAAAPAAVPQPRRAHLIPAFAYAAAAVLVLAAAAAIANVEVRYGNDGLVVRTGWAPVPDAPQAVTPTGSSQTSARPTSQPQPDLAATADFAALEQRLREIEAVLSRGPAAGQLASESRLSDAEILRRVRQIVAEAEARQEAAVARQMLDVVKDFDRQRRTDLALIQQGLDQYQGLTNAEIAQNRDLVNQIIRAATTRQER
jgi:hypothetical protein